MVSKSIQRIKNAAIFAAVPGVREFVHRAKAAGLDTLLDYQRLAMLVAAVRFTSKLEGDVIEFGAFRGGSAGVILQELAEGKTLHVCDSFEGMPDVASEDNYHRKGDFAGTSAEQVRKGLSTLGNNFEMHVGFFDKTITELERDESRKFCLAHIDVDLFQSVKDCLDFCYPRMSTGGIMIFDDYGAPTCEGAKKAVDDFFADRQEFVVPLSQPANACVIGGGDAFTELVSQIGFPANVPSLKKRIFLHKEIL